MNGQNNWSVPFSSISFMKTVLENHNIVASFVRDQDIQFDIVRKNGLPNLRAVLVNEYHLGEAAAYAVIEEFKGVNAIVNNGNWNHIILDWRDFAARTGVSVLQLADFLGAVNIREITTYVTRDEREARAKAD